MNQVLQSFAYIDPLFTFNTKFGIEVHLDAVLMEIERLPHNFCLLNRFKFAKWAYERIIILSTE